MITKDKHTFADGSVKTQVRVRQTYRPYPGAGAKRRTIKDFGYLEDQEDLEAYWAEVNACNNSLQKERTEQISLNTTQQLRPDSCLTKNYGIWFGNAVCKQLGTETFFGDAVSDDAFRYLVSDRMIFRDTLNEAIKRIPYTYGMDKLNQETFYRMLGQYGSRYIEAFIALNQSVQKLTGQTIFDLIAKEPDRVIEPDGRRTAKPVLTPALIFDEECQPVCVIPVCDENSLVSLIAEARNSNNLNRCLLIASVESELAEEMDQICSQGDSFLLLRKAQHPSALASGLDGDWRVEKGRKAEHECCGARTDVCFTHAANSGEPDLQVSGVLSDSTIPEDVLELLFLTYLKIEASLRVTCPFYDNKVPYVNTQERIRGFFLVCLTALTVIRLIQARMKGEKISAQRIADALKDAKCMASDWNGCVVMMEMLPEQQKWQDFILIQKAFNSEYYYFVSKQEDFKDFLGRLHM